VTTTFRQVFTSALILVLAVTSAGAAEPAPSFDGLEGSPKPVRPGSIDRALSAVARNGAHMGVTWGAAVALFLSALSASPGGINAGRIGNVSSAILSALAVGSGAAASAGLQKRIDGHVNGWGLAGASVGLLASSAVFIRFRLMCSSEIPVQQFISEVSYRVHAAAGKSTSYSTKRGPFFRLEADGRGPVPVDIRMTFRDGSWTTLRYTVRTDNDRGGPRPPPRS
jgi:hypothetical protein